MASVQRACRKKPPRLGLSHHDTNREAYRSRTNYWPLYLPVPISTFIFTAKIGIETVHQPSVIILSKALHTGGARLQRMMLRLQKVHLSADLQEKQAYTPGSHVFSFSTRKKEFLFEVMTVYISSAHLHELRDPTARDKDLQVKDLCQITPKRVVSVPASIW